MTGRSISGACPRIRRGRAHGACTASARREEEAMSMYIVDDEQRSDRRAIGPMRPSGSGLEGASVSLALLDDVHRHRLRRAALHLPLPSQERGPFQFSDRLLGQVIASPARSAEGQSMRGMGRSRNPGCKRSRSKAFVLQIQQLTGENPLIASNRLQQLTSP